MMVRQGPPTAGRPHEKVANEEVTEKRARFRSEGIRVGQGMDPMDLWVEWQREWAATGPADAAAAVLGTVTPKGRPAVRWVDVLFREGDLLFLTDYGSGKALDLSVHPWAELCFGHLDLGRQMRVGGEVAALSPLESDQFFAEQPRPIQLLIWASPQSQPLSSRSDIEAAVQKQRARLEGQEIPRPHHWGGYRLRPVQVEFWQERNDFIQDRVRFERNATSGGWCWTRIAP